MPVSTLGQIAGMVARMGMQGKDLVQTTRELHAVGEGAY